MAIGWPNAQVGSQGETKEKTIENIKEAIEGYILALEEDDVPSPEEHFDAMVIAV